MRISLLICAALLAGCGSDVDTLCEKLDECNLLSGTSVSECIAEGEDSVEDGRTNEADLAKCADCVDSNSCSEITDGDCDQACSGT